MAYFIQIECNIFVMSFYFVLLVRGWLQNPCFVFICEWNARKTEWMHCVFGIYMDDQKRDECIRANRTHRHGRAAMERHSSDYMGGSTPNGREIWIRQTTAHKLCLWLWLRAFPSGHCIIRSSITMAISFAWHIYSLQHIHNERIRGSRVIRCVCVSSWLFAMIAGADVFVTHLIDWKYGSTDQRLLACTFQ